MTATVAISHANYASDWMTPPEWWEWVDETLGVDRLMTPVFDPCPHDWNSEQPSGLDVEWPPGPVYCNHPGSRGSAQIWWSKYIAEQERHRGKLRFVWCAFSIEQLRHMRPSPFHLPGWLVMPRDRISFIWGGPSDDKRTHGEPCKQPTSWTVFWTNVEPATPPSECVIVRTA